MSANFTDQIFGVLADGKEVHLYTVSYGNLTFSATNSGACLTSLIVPDKNNRKRRYYRWSCNFTRIYF